MVPLFTSVVCDFCDGEVGFDRYSGFIVLQPARIGTGDVFHVFQTATDAALWRSASQLQHLELREVFSLDPIVWTRSAGSLDVVIAKQPFEIFADHRYEPRPNRAFIVPIPCSRAA